MTRTTVAALAALALTLSACSASRDEIRETNDHPASHAEAYRQLATGKRFSYLVPPGNVRGEDYIELFGDSVLVLDSWHWADDDDEPDEDGQVPHALWVTFLSRDGRVVDCWFSNNGRYEVFDGEWAVIRHSFRQEGITPTLKIGGDLQRGRPGLSPLYDGGAGEVIWYWQMSEDNRWIDGELGHVQKRLPAATWTICPEFPSARDLGVEINAAQTAATYDQLIKQDPGQRVLRPDLVASSPVGREPGT